MPACFAPTHKPLRLRSPETITQKGEGFMSDKIKIDKTRGGNSGSDLKGCYFLATTTANCYDFYDKNNNLLASNICTTTSPLGFSFNNFEGLDWTFTNVLISADTASGDWENNENAQEEVGTWEAGTGEDEAAAAGR